MNTRAHHLAAEAHGQGVGREVAAVDGKWRELWPPPSRAGEVLLNDRLAAAVAVEAGALVVLHLEQLDQVHGLAG